MSSHLHTLLMLLPATILVAAPTPVDALVRQALEADPERQAALAALAAERESASVANASQDPVLSLELGRKRFRDPSGARADEGQVWSASLTRTFEWDDRLRLRRTLADSQVELARLGLARLEQAVEARVHLLVFRLARAAQREAATGDIATRCTELRQALLARDPSGPAPLAELRAVEAAELVARSRADEAALARRQALAELNQIRGAPADAPVDVAAPRLAFREPPALAELTHAARQGNFAYRVRALEAEQLGIQSDLARTDSAPGFTAGPYVSQDRVDGRETIIGLRLDLPLPTGARSGAADRAAVERRRQAAAAVSAAWRDVERDLAQAHLAYGARLAQLRRQGADAAERFAAAARDAEQRYRDGALTLPLYLETRSACLDAVDAALALQEQAVEAGFRLRELSGLSFNPLEASR